MSAPWPSLAATLGCGDDAVLITVARVQGSAPRAAGTSMLLSRSGAPTAPSAAAIWNGKPATWRVRYCCPAAAPACCA
ncbi:hypothetical protein QF022_000199 [Vogesella perlucida]|nr:hypothetical protein [Vogesella perlucida]